MAGTEAMSFGDPTSMAIMSAGQGLMGFVQQIQGANMRKRAERNFDKYKVPQSVLGMLDVAHGLSSQTELPGADIYRSRTKSALAGATEKATRVAESPMDALGAIQQMFGSYTGFEQDLATRGAEMQRAAKQNEINVLGKIGQYQSQEWMYNELYPYIQQMNAAAQVSGAGGANVNSALSAGSSIGGANWDTKQQQDSFDQWMKSQLG